MRKEFELTQEQFDELMAASQPVPYIVVGGHPPMSPQESANRAWKKLGEELGFEYMTVQPVPGKSTHFFTAEVRG
jgi:hypothetical protein